MSKAQQEKRLLLGVITGGIMMLVSFLMDGYGTMDQVSALGARPLWVYTLCMILGAIGVPAMCLGLSAWYDMILEMNSPKWVRLLFTASGISYAVSSLYLIAIDCLPPVAFQNAVGLGMSAEDALTLTQSVQNPYTIPIVVFFLIEDIGISIVLWHLIISKRTTLPYWTLLCCPVPMLIVDVVLKAIPLDATKNISVTLESCGWLLFMLTGLLYCKRQLS
jgi:hypothetical protein